MSIDNQSTGEDHYRIVVLGHLMDGWAGWFEGLHIENHVSPVAGPVTILTGPVSDQAKLRGILNRLWDFNLRLDCCCRIEPGSKDWFIH